MFFQVRVPHLGLPLELSSRSLPREQQEDAHKGVRAKVGHWATNSFRYVHTVFQEILVN